MSNDIKFYMQRVDIPDQEEIDLETVFKGMRYAKSKGLDTIGEARTYEETFAETDKVNVYMPSEPVNKQTKVDITFYFIGENRRSVKDQFDEYIRKGIHRYWDTARNKEFEFYVKDKIEPSEELWYGSTPYIEVTYRLNNINGKTKNHVQ